MSLSPISSAVVFHDAYSVANTPMPREEAIIPELCAIFQVARSHLNGKREFTDTPFWKQSADGYTENAVAMYLQDHEFEIAKIRQIKKDIRSVRALMEQAIEVKIEVRNEEGSVLASRSPEVGIANLLSRMKYFSAEAEIYGLVGERTVNWDKTGKEISTLAREMSSSYKLLESLTGEKIGFCMMLALPTSAEEGDEIESVAPSRVDLLKRINVSSSRAAELRKNEKLEEFTDYLSKLSEEQKSILMLIMQGGTQQLIIESQEKINSSLNRFQHVVEDLLALYEEESDALIKSYVILHLLETETNIRALQELLELPSVKPFVSRWV